MQVRQFLRKNPILAGGVPFLFLVGGGYIFLIQVVDIFRLQINLLATVRPNSCCIQGQ